LKTKFALVDEVFCRSGNLEAGADIDEADHFDGHIRRLLPNESSNLHKLLLFTFWAFDKKPPKFISRAKPVAEQFDTSQAIDLTAAATVEGVKEHKRLKVVDNTEALAKAVSSLAPTDEEDKSKMEWMTASKAEHEKKVDLLQEQTNHETNEEKRNYQTWRRNECEKFLSTSLPNEVKEKLGVKMGQLAEEFLNDNF
jgi:hypothetical protein